MDMQEPEFDYDFLSYDRRETDRHPPLIQLLGLVDVATRALSRESQRERN